jgi:hypothetical protein
MATLLQPPTKPITALVLQYTDSIYSSKLPVPFTVNNKGVLDINIQDNVLADLLNDTSFSDVWFNDINLAVEVLPLGGERRVTSLSPNVLTFLRYWIIDLHPEETPSKFTVMVSPTMTKVQYILNPTVFQPYTVAGFSDEPPSSDTYVNGDSTNNFRTGWIFKTPMTIKYYSQMNGKYMYLSFISSLGDG